MGGDNHHKPKAPAKPSAARRDGRARRGAAGWSVVLFLCNLKKPARPPPPVERPAMSRKSALLKRSDLCARFYSFKY